MARATAVLLAAGRSERFGAGDKLLAVVGGRPLVERAARALVASRIDTIVAVTQGPGSAVEAVLRPLMPVAAAAGTSLQLVINASPEQGIGRSIAAGIAAVGRDADGVMIVPSDMPGLSGALFDQLLETFDATGARKIVHAATAAGAQRNPVIWPQSWFEALSGLDGDRGGKALLDAARARDPDAVLAVRIADDHLLDDIDRPEDLERWR
jgi:molybdenum cofactor cytidylyltransferase